jgi:peptide/nickel transport system permease protein
MTTEAVLLLTESRTSRGALRSVWGSYLLGRAAGLLLSLGLLIVATFLIVPLLPGDPAAAILGNRATPEAIEALREKLRLDDPLWTRFVDYLGGLLHGDLGSSFRFNIPVSEIIATKLPYTLSLALGAIVLVVVVAIPIGMLVGVATRGGRRPRLDTAFGLATGLFASIPGYVAGTLLVLVFAVILGLLPPGGAETPFSGILPTIALALGPTAAVARVVRQETQTIVAQDFMRTARGHRISAARLYLVHALPNLLTSVLTLTALILAGMIGGTVVIESVFNYPGIGAEVVQAIIYKDYPVVTGIILVIGTLAILLNLVIDLALAVADPRMLRSRTHA